MVWTISFDVGQITVSCWAPIHVRTRYEQ